MADQGMSQAELARRVGVSQPTIFALLTRNKSGSRQIHKIARALQTTPAYLSGETDDPDADAPPEPEVTLRERELLDCFNSLPTESQAALIHIAHAMADKVKQGPTVHTPRVSFRANPTAQ